jgi:1-acyl-sn-glycerol-3-phosphate acyltransferase
MRKKIGAILMKLFGWKTDSIPTEMVKGTVLIAAPHTSNWDFFFLNAAMWQLNWDMKFMIKDSHTNHFLYGWLVKAIGGIGINRSQKNDMINYCTKLLQENPNLILTIPAEGTRKKSTKWKLGFYHIALQANVPISLGYLDYEKKIAGVGKLVYPNKKTKEELFKEIEEFYHSITPKYPENYTPTIE